MIAYIYDFLIIFFEKLKEKEKIRNIILFGSVARGNQGKNSDIDLFIDINKKDKKYIEEIIKESLNEFELKLEKTWKLKGIDNPIVPIVDDLETEQWKELKNEISNYGILLYGSYKKIEERKKIIIKYEINKLKQKNKMKIIRNLFGYKLKQKNKAYEKRGLISKIKAEKISSAILSDKGNYKEIIKILKENKVPFKLIEL